MRDMIAQRRNVIMGTFLTTRCTDGFFSKTSDFDVAEFSITVNRQSLLLGYGPVELNQRIST